MSPGAQAVSSGGLTPGQGVQCTGKDPVTVMSHSATVPLDDDSFFEVLPWLRYMFGIAGMDLVKFTSIPGQAFPWIQSACDIAG